MRARYGRAAVATSHAYNQLRSRVQVCAAAACATPSTRAHIARISCHFPSYFQYVHLQMRDESDEVIPSRFLLPLITSFFSFMKIPFPLSSPISSSTASTAVHDARDSCSRCHAGRALSGQRRVRALRPGAHHSSQCSTGFEPGFSSCI